MKQGKTLQDLASEVQRVNAAKRDLIAATPTVLMDREGRIGVHQAGPMFTELAVQDYAHGQIAAWSGIPKKYYDVMRSQAPDLLSENVNHWLVEKKDRRMLRTLDGRLRAFVSDTFRRLDNAQVVEAALPAIMDVARNGAGQHDWTVASCDLTETRLYLKITFPFMREEVRRGDLVEYGLCISNSEIGAGSLAVDEFFNRLACLNGMKVATPIKRRHVGRRIEDEGELTYSNEALEADDRAFFLKFRDQVKAIASPENFQKRIEQMRQAAGDRIETKVDELVEVLANRASLLNGERESVLEHLIRDGDLTRWGLANAVTRTAADCTSYDRASELEAIGGKLIELKPTEWRRLQAGQGEVQLAEAA